MRITADDKRIADEKYHARNVKTELTYCGSYMRDRRNITDLDLQFYAWLFRAALERIEALEKQITEVSNNAEDS